MGMAGCGVDCRSALEDLLVFKKAQQQMFQLKNVLNRSIFSFINEQAKGIGCEDELVFFPLVTAVCSQMASNTRVIVHNGWQEKMVISCIVGARRGERKTAAFCRVKNAIKNANALPLETVAMETASEIHQQDLLLDEISVREIENVCDTQMYSNINVILFDDLDLFLKDEITMARIHRQLHLLKAMYDDSSDSCLIRNEAGQHNFTSKSISFAATMEACSLVSMCNQADPFGLLDRSLIICVPDCSTMTSTSSASLNNMLSTVRKLHMTSGSAKVYKISTEGHKMLNRCLRTLQKTKESTTNDKRRGSISQAAGQIVRLSAALTAMMNALMALNKETVVSSNDVDDQDIVIPREMVLSAFLIVKTVLKQKFCLFAAAESPEIQDSEAEQPETLGNAVATDVSVGDKEHQVKDTTPTSQSPGQSMNSANQSCGSVTTGSPIPEVVDLANTEEQYTVIKQEPVMEYNMDADVASKGQQQLHHLQSQFSVALSNVPVSQLVGFNQYAVDGTTNQQLNSTLLPVDCIPGSLPLLHDKGTDQSANSFVPTQSTTQCQQIYTNQASYTRPSPYPVPKSGQENFGSMPSSCGIVRPQQYTTALRVPDKMDIYELDDEDFLFFSGTKIKKLLLTQGFTITAAFACQYRLFPPIPKPQRQSPMKTQYPAWAAGKFFERLEKLELGTIMKPRDTHLSIRFQKIRLEDMSDRGRRLLKKINLSEIEYQKTYPKN